MSIEKYVSNKSLMGHKGSVTGTAGKGMVVAGGSALMVPVLAAFIPFLGTMAVAIVLIVLGLMFWE